MLDGGLVINELVDWVKRSRKEGFIFKADF